MRRLRPLLAGIVAAITVLPLLPVIAEPVAAATGSSPSETSSAAATSTATPAATSTTTPAIGSEIVGRRTQNTKTFSTSTPGTLYTKVYSQPVHYLNSSGAWTDINTSLVTSTAGRLATLGTQVGVNLASKANDPGLARLAVDATHQVAFGLAGAAPVTGKQSASDTMLYQNVLPQTDLQLQALNGGTKESIILKSTGAPTTYTFPLTLQGLTATLTPQGEIAYVDSSGTIQEITPQGYMQDSADPVHHVGVVSQGVTYTLTGNPTIGQKLVVTLDKAWLDAPSRVYPVVVDPTTSYYNTGEDDTYVMSNFTRDNASDPMLKLGTYDGGTHIGIDFMNFNVSALNGMIINDAYFYALNDYSWSCSPRPVGLYQVTQGWGGHTMQSYPGATLGAQVGVNVPFAMGNSSSCPAGWAYWDIQSTVQNWVSGAWGQYGLALKVQPGYETDDYSYKYFDSYDGCNGGFPCSPFLGISWSAPTVPGSPQSPSAAVSGSGQANVTWGAPASNGGATVDEYVVYAYNANNTYANIYTVPCGTCTSSTLGGLTPGNAYYFDIYAHNSAGWGAGSQSNTITAVTTPSAPTSPGAAVNGVGSAAVTWSAPANNGYAGIDEYAVYAYNANGQYGGTYALPCGSCTSASLGGLSPGTSYYFLIYAHNVVGWGPAAQTANFTAATSPGSPLNVAAAANGSGAATVIWSAPSSNGFSSITGYTVAAYYDSNHTAAGINATVCGTCTQATLTGLTPGTKYYFAVSARNLAGSGPAANSATITVASSSPPVSIFAPTNVVATVGNGQASLTWTAPALSLPGLTSYSVTTYRASDGTLLATAPAGTSTNAVVTGMTNGVTVTFTVTGSLLGLTGQSPASNAVTPSGPPSAPTTVTAMAGDGQAIVTWSGANSNGSPITGYTITAYTSSNNASVSSATTTASSLTVLGLNNGTAYYFTVHTTNANASSGESPRSNTVTPAGLPLAPTNVVATPGSFVATVSWTAPSSNGSALTGYTVSVHNAGTGAVVQTYPTGGSPATVPNLSNGTAYYFTVHATNLVGNGPESAPSNTITPAGPSSEPTNVVATPGDGFASATWTAAQPNGTPVTSYTITSSPGGVTATTLDGSTTTATVTGLTLGTSYIFYVVAHSAAGDSAPSVPSNPIIPVAAFRIDLKAWIPQYQVVDPLEPAQEPFPGLEFLYAPCGVGTSVMTHFLGNNHTGWNDGDGSYKVLASIQFQWNGHSVVNEATSPDAPFGTTHLVATYYDPLGNVISTCELASATQTQSVTGTASGSSFALSYNAANPLGPPGTPSITGQFNGTIAPDGSITGSWQSTEFPSQGVQVLRDNKVQYTAIQDVSCLGDAGVNGASGFYNLTQGLTTQGPVNPVSVGPNDFSNVPVISRSGVC